ncbi:MAG TPA: hypothetical protein VE344_01165 [Methylomirabilota bacterium]|nr:hypothetical protein [Methylomirabilota bacterium]
MRKDYKIYKGAKFFAGICGGWLGLMSSIPSIPLLLAGFYYTGTQRDWFWVSAFICLWFFAIQVCWKNYQLMGNGDKKEKSRKAVEQLTQFGQIIMRRISAIKGIDPNRYDPNKDDESWNVISEAAGYIFMTLTHEAVVAFGAGIEDIHGYSIPHSGLGSTMYEDRYREMLAKLHRRFMNLKSIVDEIDKYIK